MALFFLFFVLFLRSIGILWDLWVYSRVVCSELALVEGSLWSVPWGRLALRASKGKVYP